MNKSVSAIESKRYHFIGAVGIGSAAELLVYGTTVKPAE